MSTQTRLQAVQKCVPSNLSIHQSINQSTEGLLKIMKMLSKITQDIKWWFFKQDTHTKPLTFLCRPYWDLLMWQLSSPHHNYGRKGVFWWVVTDDCWLIVCVCLWFRERKRQERIEHYDVNLWRLWRHLFYGFYLQEVSS